MTAPSALIPQLPTQAPITDRATSAALKRSPADESREDFASVLLRSSDMSQTKDPTEKARKIAEDFVSVALVQPILTQLRATNNAWGPFAPSAHEKQFGPLADAATAKRITRSGNFGIVDAVSRQLLSYLKRTPKPASLKP